jgi:DNA-binding NarL/FixJ family response regulator
MRILIAEDDAVLTDGLSRSLRAAGYAVDAVASGDAADSALAAQTYDLVILESGPAFSWKCSSLRARNSTVPRDPDRRDSVGSVKGSILAPTTTWPSRLRCPNSRRELAR